MPETTGLDEIEIDLSGRFKQLHGPGYTISQKDLRFLIGLDENGEEPYTSLRVKDNETDLDLAIETSNEGDKEGFIQYSAPKRNIRIDFNMRPSGLAITLSRIQIDGENLQITQDSLISTYQAVQSVMDLVESAKAKKAAQPSTAQRVMAFLRRYGWRPEAHA